MLWLFLGAVQYRIQVCQHHLVADNRCLSLLQCLRAVLVLFHTASAAAFEFFRHGSTLHRLCDLHQALLPYLLLFEISNLFWCTSSTCDAVNALLLTNCGPFVFCEAQLGLTRACSAMHGALVFPNGSKVSITVVVLHDITFSQLIACAAAGAEEEE